MTRKSSPPSSSQSPGQSDPFTLALDYLAQRDRSLFEVEAKLKTKGVGDEQIPPVLERLVSLGYLDEERLARALVRDTRMASRGPRTAWLKIRHKKIEGWSLERVTEEWRQGQDSAFGVRPELSPESCQEADPELEVALAFIRRRYPEHKTDRKQAQRALGALLRRGFSFDKAKEALGI